MHCMIIICRWVCVQLYSETIDKKSFWRSIRGPASHTTVAVASIASDLYIDVRYIYISVIIIYLIILCKLL